MFKKSIPLTTAMAPQQPSDLGIGSLTLTAQQLREALVFANPDGTDEAETEVTITHRMAFKSTDGDEMSEGLYVHFTEYPDEGVFGPLGQIATSDNQLGIAWWNQLSDVQRTHWMLAAGNTGIVADAWAVFKKGLDAEMHSIGLNRDALDGFLV